MGLDSIIALKDYLEFKEIESYENFFITTVLVEKGKETVSNEKREIQIARNTYGGWKVMVEDLKGIVGYETFNTDFQNMTYSRGNLLIESNGYSIYLL